MTIAPATQVDALEQRLGDPFDSGNPHGFDAILAAAEGQRDLDPEPWRTPPGDPEARLHALRARCRRSPALALGPDTSGAHHRAAVVTAGACVGALDSALRVTVRHLRARRLYGAAAIDLPVLRSVLSGAFADLLLCDALATVAVGGTDASPVTADAATRLVPRVLQGAMDRLSVLMGSRFYIREGETATFQRLLQETQRTLFAVRGPASESACLAPPTEPVATTALADLYDPQLLAAAPGHAITGAARRATQPAGLAHERLYADLVHRYEGARAFDLTGRALPDRP